MGKYNDFRKELEQLINRHSMEQESNTPDYILAEYLVECLQQFERTIKSRDYHFQSKIDLRMANK